MTHSPIPTSPDEPWWQRTGVAVLPLRLFLGVTFVYAGLLKLWDPAYLDPSAPQSVQAQMAQFAQTSPIAPLVSLAASHASSVGLLIAIGELAAGLGALLGLWTRLAALGGLVLALSFWLTVSWETRPYFYGSDIVFVFGWLTLLLAGDGQVASVGAAIAAAVRRSGPAGSGRVARAELERRVLLRSGAVAALVGAGALGTGGLTAWLGRRGGGHAGTANAATSTGTASTGPGTANPTPEPGAAAPAAPAASAAPATPAAPATRPPGSPVGRASALPVGHARLTRDPATREPVWLVHDRQGMRAFSAVCTHAGCTVGFDRGSGGFACPCHGARFDAAGRVLNGPAEQPLSPVQVAVVDNEIWLV